MLHRLAMFAAVVIAAFVISPAAFAKHGHGGHGHGHWHGHHHYGHAHWNHYHDWDRGRVNWNAPFRGRYWGGRWWGYGEGACWRRVPGGYVWICR